MEAALDSLLLAACLEVLPAEQARIVQEPGEGVSPCPEGSFATGGDYRCRAARTVFHRLRRASKGDLSYECPCPSLGGLPKRWSFVDAECLARTLLEHLPSEAGAIVADARAVVGGEIAITTRGHLAWQRSRGQLLCADCGRFYAGERGLQDHQRTKHGKAVVDALEAVDLSRLQVIPVRLPATCLATAAVALVRGEVEQKQQAAKAAPELDELLLAARDGQLATLRALTGKGWDPKLSRDRHGSNALLWAAGGGHLDICRFLVEECHLDVHWVQKDRRNALHWAARNGHLETCRWLVGQKGLDPDAPTVDGTVALHWAVWQCHEEVCNWFVLEARANLHAKNCYGCNASQWAALAGSVPMNRWLQKAGLDLHVLNNNGHSALHKAAVKGQGQVCEWLLEDAGLGLPQMQPDSDGNTPAIMARCGGFEALARRLEERLTALEELHGWRPTFRIRTDAEQGICRHGGRSGFYGSNSCAEKGSLLHSDSWTQTREHFGTSERKSGVFLLTRNGTPPLLLNLASLIDWSPFNMVCLFVMEIHRAQKHGHGVDAAQSWEQTISNEARRHGAGQLFVTPVFDGFRCTGAARPESCWCLVVPEVRQLLCYADSQEHAAGRRPLHVIHLARAAVWPYDESAEAGGEAGQFFARLQACSCSAAFIIDEPPARQSAGEEPSRKRTTAFGTRSTGDLKPWLELIQTLCGAGPLRKSFGLGPEEDLERPSWATFWEDSPRKGRPGDHRGSDGSAEGGKTAQEDEQSMEAESSDDEPFSRLARLRPSFALAIREAAQAAAAATAAKGSQNRSVQSSGAAGGEVDGSGFPSVAGDNVAFASIRSSETSSVASEASVGNPGDGDSFASAASGEETEAGSSDDGTEGDQQALRQLQRLSVKLRREGRRLEKELHSGECLARTTLAFFGEKAPNAGALAALQVFLCQISGFAREFAAAVTKVREHQDRRGAKGRAITRVASGTRIGGAKSGAAGRVLAPGPMNMVVPGPMHMVDDGIATPPPPPPPAQRGAGVHRLVVEQPLYPGRAPAQLGQASQ
ncbi:unnamed protein product [Polarella glacialis]|uniref:C2H2-type domain-containing protein n=1 Tax=Polarella glacialis TaxID=89957 RepID=A0A813GWJ1_POLGL|nr:unnamed protein product [Polarella glacialis]